MATISAEDVRRLLESGEPEPTLVLLEGRAQVVARRDLEAEPYRGALVVASRDDVAAGWDPAEVSDDELNQLAQRLDTAVSDLGG
ncbi:hypothetical protein [Bailinhaonella thermotolerans]|uniref:Uncharacterized protein n=1 Tax=Bailinhaonella thermotolerans TaxID=1070861 RepID=A0A3A4A2S0_9ACTN|nr:hypothetical protein [Bailinhaonella thermotolerans]RJL22725.1 hypothetical protein D5H75_34600 [Bailinhaonella thermotolerans]